MATSPRAANEKLQSLLPHVALALCGSDPLAQHDERRLLLVQQRRRQVQVTLGHRTIGVSRSGDEQPEPSPLVPLPQRDRLLEAKNGPGKVLIVASFSGLGQVLFGPVCEQRALGMGVVQPNRDLEIEHAWIAILLLAGHGLQGDVHELARFFGGLNLVASNRIQTTHHVLAGVRRPAGDDLVQDSAEQVDVAGHSDSLERTAGHLRRHVGGRASHAARLRDRAQVPEPRGQ